MDTHHWNDFRKVMASMIRLAIWSYAEGEVALRVWTSSERRDEHLYGVEHTMDVTSRRIRTGPSTSEFLIGL